MTDAKKRFTLPLNLQLFSADPDPIDPPADPQEPPKTFTQAELDDIVAKRLDRERKKYADYDDKAKRLAELEQAEEERKKADMTEKERLEAEKVEAARTAAEAVETAKKAQDAANQRVIKSEFRALAREMGIRADALDDALKLADLSGVTVDDEGNAPGVKDVVTALAAAKPYLVEVPKKEPKQIGEPSNPAADEIRTLEQQLEEAKKKRDFAKVVELSNKISTIKK